jgi:hypothetical protein
MDSFLNPSGQSLSVHDQVALKIQEYNIEQLVNFNKSIQMKCMDYCEDEVNTEENANLSDESLYALEKQCVRTCNRKYTKAYHMYHDIH